MASKQQSEKEFLKNYNIHDYEVPLTSVDLVIFTVREERLHVLLVKRADHPFMGQWSLPGGFIDVHKDKNLEATALRKLKEKTGVKAPYLEQLQGFGSKTRDPRGWSSTFVYFALIPSDLVELSQGSAVDAVQWFPIAQDQPLPHLAFDHTEILEVALQRLYNKVEYSSLAAHLLPAEFTLSELQQMYQLILGRPLDKSAFRKRIKEGDFLEELNGQFRYGSNRPAQLYRLKQGLGLVYYARSLSSD
ncbi:NUDIX domain-containing protein [Undibacterium cyanobacteriorum]|uniref:NUDIX domain-containing protein n=1 Tax=Undibacterium cyanobacteriorum TaxID=3073561 RepID=A0ABY9RI08_9BURK|nr:NUDIX domain-containing protein [Undibacterium sp. 20NA77.5]WMW80304.1 NUDIX domain-containing protein [Undibacterium sp. 20NA77.5]